MNEQAILALCEKLGTTVEELIPKVIAYGLHQSAVELIIFGLVTVCGLGACIFGRRLEKKDPDTFAPIVFYIFGCVGLIFGIVGIGFSISDVYLWNTVPEATAYRTLLNWIK